MNDNITSCAIKGLVLQPAGRYQPVHRRPLVAKVTPDLPDYIGTVVEEGGIDALTPEFFMNKLSGVVAPSSETRGISPIANGWEEDRLIWIMQVECTSDNGAKHMETYSGYCDYYGLTSSKFGGSFEIDPEMELIVDQVNRKSVTRYRNGGNRPLTSVISKSDVIISREATEGVSMREMLTDSSSGLTFAQRPKDVSLILSLDYHARQNNMEPGGLSVDSRNSVMTPKASSMRNLSGPRFLSIASRGMLGAMQESKYGDNSSSLYSAAGSRTPEMELRELTLLSILRGGASSASTKSSFIISDLTFVDPDIMDKITIAENGGSSFDRDETMDCRGWGGSDLSTTHATWAITSLLSIMSRYGIGRVDFTTVSSTEPFSGNMALDTAITDVLGIGESVSSEKKDALTHVITNEVVAPLTMDGEIPIDIRISASANNNVYIEIGIDGGPIESYNLPAFALSKLSINASNEREDISNMGFSIEDLMSGISIAS